MANSFLRIALLFSTLAGFAYGKLCTDQPDCHRIDIFTGLAVINPAACTTMTPFFDIRSKCPGRCGVTCCNFFSNCDAINAATACLSPTISSRCPEKCNTCAFVAGVPPASLVPQMAAENCNSAGFLVVTVAQVNPKAVAAQPNAVPAIAAVAAPTAGFRCCFDNTLQVCNDRLAVCTQVATLFTYEQAELICKFRGGHLCSAEETRLDCCQNHKCSDIVAFTNRAMWLGSSKPATLSTIPPPIVPTAVPTMAPPPPTAAPTPAPTVAPTTTGCRDNYPAQCARLSTYNNFQSMCNSEGAYRRMCKKSCGVC